MYSYPKAGLITIYGNSSSHEADLTRCAGIPALINLKVSRWRLTGDSQGIVLENGDKLKEGDRVVIDGDRNALYVTVEDILQEDRVTELFGVRILEVKRRVFASFKDEDGSFKEGVTVGQLQSLYEKALADFKRLDGHDARGAFLVNIAAHFLHQLLLELEKEKGDQAMGGIDLSSDKAMQIKKDSHGGIKFNIDHAMLDQLRHSTGFMPGNISIEPMTDLKAFLLNSPPDE